MARGAALVLDVRKVLPGRGASLHPRPDCLELAVRRRAFPRALRTPGPLEHRAVAEWVAEHEDAPRRTRR